MDLSTYLEQNDVSIQEISRETGIPVNSFYRWKRRANKPSPLHIKIIEKFTNGKVTKKDWKWDI